MCVCSLVCLGWPVCQCVCMCISLCLYVCVVWCAQNGLSRCSQFISRRSTCLFVSRATLDRLQCLMDVIRAFLVMSYIAVPCHRHVICPVPRCVCVSCACVYIHVVARSNLCKNVVLQGCERL